MTTQKDIGDCARKLVRGSIIENATVRLISQIMTEVAETHVAPLQERVTELERGLRTAVEFYERLGVSQPWIAEARLLLDKDRAE